MQYSHTSLCTLVLSVKVSLMLHLTYANMGKTQRCFVLVADCTLWWYAFSNFSSRYTRSPLRGWRWSCEELSDRTAVISCHHLKLVPYTCRKGSSYISVSTWTRSVFLNRQATARYWALASIILGSERPEETTICYKISLVQLIINLNVILYLSTCHTIYISVLILFMIMS